MKEKKFTPAKIGHVYFIISGDGYCKIGRSANPASRLGALQSGTAQRLHLHHEITTDSQAKCESFLHKAFRHYRTRGEWFDLPGYILTLIRDIETLNMVDMSKALEETIHSWLPPDKNPRLVEERLKAARKSAQEAKTLAARKAETRAFHAGIFGIVRRFVKEMRNNMKDLRLATEELKRTSDELKKNQEEWQKCQQEEEKERERWEKSLSLHAKLDDWRRASSVSLTMPDKLKDCMNKYIDSLAVQSVCCPHDRLLTREDAATLLDCSLYSVSHCVAPFSRRPARYRLSDLIHHIAEI